jgi:hypothetical protein
MRLHFELNELNAIKRALRYYRDEATHYGDSEIAGLKTSSEEYKLITAALREIEAELSDN